MASKVVEPQLAALIESGDVKFIFANMVVIQESQPAHEAAECAADQGKFWAYHDLLMAKQAGKFSKDTLKKFAADLSLETGAFNQCLDSGKYAKKVQQDTAEALKLGITGTPTFFLNGKPLQNLQTFDDVAAAVKKELKQQ